jgi:hypothetical protein
MNSAQNPLFCTSVSQYKGNAYISVLCLPFFFFLLQWRLEKGEVYENWQVCQIYIITSTFRETCIL